LHRPGDVAIVPPPLPEQSLDEPQVVTEDSVLQAWLRCLLVAVALGLCTVFGIAIYLNPYREDGEARTMETHRQLGLPECTFKELTGRPCPSCGMTTSFALLIRGDVVNSARANFVGTLLATVCLAFIPWAVASAWRARYFWIESLEWFLPRFIVVLMVLLLTRWAVVLVTF
jgi:hypothetical protein